MTQDKQPPLIVKLATAVFRGMGLKSSWVKNPWTGRIQIEAQFSVTPTGCYERCVVMEPGHNWRHAVAMAALMQIVETTPRRRA